MNTTQWIPSWLWLRRAAAAHPCAATSAARAANPDLDPEPDPETDPAPIGCGWFDSSHELERGLVVCEHASAASLAGQLPLASWLEWHLCGWHAALPA